MCDSPNKGGTQGQRKVGKALKVDSFTLAICSLQGVLLLVCPLL